MKVSFLTAGGIAPCLSASIGRLIKKYSEADSSIEMIGYLNGYKGLLSGNSIPISKDAIDGAEILYQFGGSPLGNSRVKLSNIDDCIKNGYIIAGENPLEVAAKQLIRDEVNILHTIGGDDTNTTAGELVSYFAKNGQTLIVVGLPKTVDNDVFPIQQTLGAWTAAEQGAIYFENLSNGNSDRVGQIIQELVIADLSGIDGFKVFSSQRLFDIQKQMGIDSRMIDQSIALNVAKMAGAVHMITGNIIDRVEQQILTANILNVDDGSILQSRQVRGQDIFAMVDDLTALVKNDIDLKRADRILDVNVKEKTTSNMEAYNHYLEGVDLLYQSLFDKSISSFNKAISLDPNFKQAYFKLADTQLWAYYFNESHETLEQLSKLPNLTENDQQIILGIEYLIREENEKAEAIYQTLANKESDNKEYWYSLGESIYHGRANMLEALDAFENAVNLDPSFALSYVHIFDIYLNRELFNRGFN